MLDSVKSVTTPRSPLKYIVYRIVIIIKVPAKSLETLQLMILK